MNLENKKQVATILLAIGLGLVAAFLTGQYVRSSVIQQADAYKERFEKKTVTPLLQEMDFLKQELKKVAAQAAQVKQQPLQPVVAEKKKEDIQKQAFAAATPSGKRALTIMIDSLSAVGGLIQPGDYVDVIAHLEVKDETNSRAVTEKITSTLFQNVQVLAVGTSYKATGVDLQQMYDFQQKTRSLNVTLALSPEEAGLLTFAQNNGHLQLSLRPPEEGKTSVLQVASWDTLADFVLEHQGTELIVPKEKTLLKAVEEEPVEVKPFIQIFKAGKEL